jgi:hypothetical protein
MERGPLALFGAIVAVGLGPAMWLGAQFGHAGTPDRLPTISEQSTEQAQEPGGKAGAAPEDPTPIDLRPRPRSDVRPITVRPSTSTTTKGRTVPRPVSSASTSPSGAPSTSAPASTEPDDPPTEESGNGNGTPPPSPPAAGDTGRGIPVDLPVR